MLLCNVSMIPHAVIYAVILNYYFNLEARKVIKFKLLGLKGYSI